MAGPAKEFDNLPGCIIMTTNCLMRPRDSYKDRIYSTNVVGWEGVKHIEKKSDGEKDFSPVIRQALELEGLKKILNLIIYLSVLDMRRY